MLHASPRVADVYGFSNTDQPTSTSIPIATCATAYTFPTTGETFIIVHPEMLYFGPSLDHTLLNPNQIRKFGVPYWDNPYDPHHDMSIELPNGYTIPLITRGTKIGFTSRVPTTQELENCTHIDIASGQPWEPMRVQLGELVTNPTALPTNTTNPPAWERTPEGEAVYLDPTTDEAILHSMQHTSVGLSELTRTDVPDRNTFVSTDRHSRTTANLIADRFGIGIQRARATMQVTRNRGTRSAILPLARRYRADRRYEVKRLNSKFATDALYADVRSIGGNCFAQLYSHKCGFASVYPMRKLDGNNVGNSLKDFIHEYGAPRHLTFDGASVHMGPNTEFKRALLHYEIPHHVSAP